MLEEKIDYLIVGPASPFRGGIANTQHELGLQLQSKGKKVQLLTFTKLYPKLLFPGKNQKEERIFNSSLTIVELIHAFNPFFWSKAVTYINKVKPKYLIFRYYTPFLAPVYGWIAKKTKKEIKKIGLVDNWIPHERNFLDTAFNSFFGKKMNAFTTLSSSVALQLKNTFNTPVWEGFHPIHTHLLPPISKEEARKKLGWNPNQTIVLFFGLIRKYKGVELLIKAFAEEKIPTDKIVLKVVGECYENEKKYRDLVALLELENCIEFDFNYKTTSDIQLLFSASDLVAQTYHTATQSGVTPLAYFYNKPLIVTDIEGLKTPIKKDRTGLIVQKNPSDIARGILQLLEKDEYHKAKENLIASLPHYDWKLWVEQWNEFIENLEC
jgi:D-inositol-3-phosphate glycosyltransferase